MTLLCMTALASSGKDTAAQMFSEQTGLDMYALAKPIKDIMCALFGWDDSHRDGSMKEVEILYPVTPDNLEKAGEVYNSYGLDKYEAFHDCWEKLILLFGLHSAGYEYNAIISPRRAFQLFGTDWGRKLHDPIWLEVAPTENVIITDVRFDNEAGYFKDLGATIIKVVRDKLVEVTAHVSENGINPDYVDVELDNNGSLHDLEATIRYIISVDYLPARYARGFK